MILSVALAMLQAEPAEVLIVDGLVVGMHTKQGWSKPDPDLKPFPKGMKLVGVGTVAEGAMTIHIVPNSDSTALVSKEKLRDGVFYSGEVRQPRPSRIPLQREAVMASAAQFARTNGVANPRPYLLSVFEVSVDDSGKQYELISATSRPPTLSDYLMQSRWEAVILRWQNKIFPLSVSFPKAGEKLSQCRLRAVGDFDGDGHVEFVTTSTQPTLFIATLWSFRSGKLTPVLDVSYEVNS